MLGNSLLGSVVDLVFRPAAFLRSRPEPFGRGWWGKAWIVGRSLAFLAANLLLYAAPLTVAFADLAETDPLAGVLVVAYPFALLTGVTVWAFHAAVVVTRNSRGFVTSLQTVTTTVGVYLALAIGFAFPVLVARGPLGEFLRGATMYLFIFSGDTVSAPAPSQVVVVLAVVAGCYYAYALYAAAQVRHGATRFEGAVVTVLSLTAPVLVFPWLTSSEESALPQVFFSTDLIVVGAVLGVLSVFAVTTDLVRSTLR
jgi:hypothetical protein